MKILPLLCSFVFGLPVMSAVSAPAVVASEDSRALREICESQAHASEMQADGTYLARNPGQQWQAAIDGCGFTVTPDHREWTWGLQLESYGDSISPPQAVPQELSGKIILERDAFLTEWFVNDRRGLEQGWTFHTRPPGGGGGKLRLELMTRGNLSPRVSESGVDVDFTDGNGRSVLCYGGLKAWDADGKVLAVKFTGAECGLFGIEVDDSAARYPVTVDPVAQQAQLMGPSSFLGVRAIAISGDTAVVGVEEQGVNCVHVFVRTGTSWAFQARIVNPHPLPPDYWAQDDDFGAAVGISGNTIVIGAPFENSASEGVDSVRDFIGGGGNGAAYIFQRTGTAWSLQAYLKAEVNVQDSRFGASVSIDGDVAVVGSPRDMSRSPEHQGFIQGSATVFVRVGNVWQQQAYLASSHFDSNYAPVDGFGTSVSNSGETIVVGAPYDDGMPESPGGLFPTPDSGAVYVFTRVDNTWTEQAYLQAGNASPGESFGFSVAMSGDTILVGAAGESSVSIGVNGQRSLSGVGYVFQRSGVSWSQQAYLKASRPESEAGCSVALHGDVAILGTNFSSPSYLFIRNSGAWTQHQELPSAVVFAVNGGTVVASSTDSSQNSSVTVLAPLDLMVPEIAVTRDSAEILDGGTVEAGDVELGAIREITLTVRNFGQAALTGLSVSKDGAHPADFQVGPLTADTLASGETATFVVRFSPGAADFRSCVLHLASNDPDESSFEIVLTGIGTDGSVLDIAQRALARGTEAGPGDNFGRSVAVSGNTVVVGAPLEDSSTVGMNSTPNESATDSGAAFVFVRNGGLWVQQAYLKAQNPSAGDGFGGAVAITGDTIVIGAPFEDGGSLSNGSYNDSVTNSGAAYVFARNGVTWSQQAYLKAANPTTSSEFGYSVAISGDSVVVGSYREDLSGSADAGAAHVFTRSGALWTHRQRLIASNPDTDDRFGVSVAIHGDCIVVGAPEEDSASNTVNGLETNNSASSAGAAYVFTRQDSVWTKRAYLKASNAGAGDHFGISVAVSNDYIVVGADLEDSSTTGVNPASNEGALNSGAAYVFSAGGPPWTQQAFLKASNTGASDNFGHAVAISGKRVVVGASAEDSSTTGVSSTGNNLAADSGAVYIYGRGETSWDYLYFVKASNTGAGDSFGEAVAISGNVIVSGAPLDDVSGNDNTGAFHLFSNAPPLPPEIAVERDGVDLTTGASVSFPTTVTGENSVVSFLIKNKGAGVLALSSSPQIVLSGPGAASYQILSFPSATVAPGASTTFSVRFQPSTAGLKSAVIAIPNNDPDKNPFQIQVVSRALSYQIDTDGDGLNDASEYKMSPLGFNWELPQPQLVSVYYENANGAGLFKESQVQALHAGTPLISRDPLNGRFKLVMDWKKSTDLAGFSDFPAPAGSASSINAQGDIEFEFSVPDKAAFFRLEVD